MPGPRLLAVDEMERTLISARTIAVLGIKPESRRSLDAHQIPLYLRNVGYEILPVPTRYPEVSHILGVAVVRRLLDLPRPVDVLNVFCKSEDFATRIDEVVMLRPGVVWFQSGLLDDQAALRLDRAGLRVAEDCIGCRRASMHPSLSPLAGQRADMNVSPHRG